jgi:hypothetical protein
LAEPVHDHVAVTLEQRHERLDPVDDRLLLVGGEQGDQPTVVERVPALPGRLGRPFEGSDQPLGVRFDHSEGLLDQLQEVTLHPGHGPELGPVGHLVKGDPQPEVAGTEPEALLEVQHVGPDVVDGVDVAVADIADALIGDQQVVLAEDPLTQEPEEDPHLGAGHLPSRRGEGALGHALRHPGGEGLERPPE